MPDLTAFGFRLSQAVFVIHILLLALIAFNLIKKLFNWMTRFQNMLLSLQI